jgi:hypothetical protein
MAGLIAACGPEGRRAPASVAQTAADAEAAAAPDAASPGTSSPRAADAAAAPDAAALSSPSPIDAPPGPAVSSGGETSWPDAAPTATPDAAPASPPDATRPPTPDAAPPPEAGVPALPASGNLFDNAGFESGALDPWIRNAAPDMVNLGAHGGAFAARLGGAGPYVSQNLQPRLKAGVRYLFRAWVRVTALSPTGADDWGSPALRLSRYADLGTSDFGAAGALKDLALGWQELTVSHTFTAEDLAGGAVWVGVRHFGFNGQSLLDDLSAAPM